MDNRDIKRKNYYRFKHAALCGCIACQLARPTKSAPVAKVDYFDPEDYEDDDGWF